MKQNKFLEEKQDADTQMLIKCCRILSQKFKRQYRLSYDDASDLFQDAFLAGLELIKNYNPEIVPPDKKIAYVMLMLQFKLRNIMRAQRTKAKKISFVAEITPNLCGATEELTQDFTASILNRFIGRLNQDDRAIFTHYIISEDARTLEELKKWVQWSNKKLSIRANYLEDLFKKELEKCYA